MQFRPPWLSQSIAIATVPWVQQALQRMVDELRQDQNPALHDAQPHTSSAQPLPAQALPAQALPAQPPPAQPPPAQAPLWLTASTLGPLYYPSSSSIAAPTTSDCSHPGASSPPSRALPEPESASSSADSSFLGSPVSSAIALGEAPPQDFTLVLAPGFTGLLVVYGIGSTATAWLCLEPEAIAQFIQALDQWWPQAQTLSAQTALQSALQAWAGIALNPLFQARFTSLILTGPSSPPASKLQTFAQEISANLLLGELLDQTCQSLQHLLNAQRVILFGYAPQLLHPLPEGASIPLAPLYEARCSPARPPVDSLLEFVPLAKTLLAVAVEHRPRSSSSPFNLGEPLSPHDPSPEILELPNLHHYHPQIAACLSPLGFGRLHLAPLHVAGEAWGGLIVDYGPEKQRPAEQPDLSTTVADRQFLHQALTLLGPAIAHAQEYTQLHQHQLELERQLRSYSQELRDTLAIAYGAEKNKTEFMAIMSHELRTPLTCIIGMSATLLRWSFGPLSDRQRDYLQTIHQSGEQLLGTINGILDLSQVEAGRTLLQLRELSLIRLAQHCTQLFQSRAMTSGVQLKLHLRLTGDQDRFIGDVHRIEQILIHLLENAIKFTPSGGSVWLRVWREGDLCLLQVQDTGIGIAPTQQALLFQKFQQLETSRRRQYNGLGLGLALTKQLIQLHSGDIQLESEPGIGSTFTVRIPSQPLPIKPLPPIPKTSDLPSQIVLLDDQEARATLICELLTAAGYQVIWLSETSTAFGQIQILKPQAIIANLECQGGSVPDLLRQVQALKGLGVSDLSPHVIILGSTEPQAIAEGLAVDAVLPLPFVPHQLVSYLLTLEDPHPADVSPWLPATIPPLQG